MEAAKTPENPTPPALTATGRVVDVEPDYLRVEGLEKVTAGELLRLPGGGVGVAEELESDHVRVLWLTPDIPIVIGDAVWSTGTVPDFPADSKLSGRWVDLLGRPLDGLAPLSPARPLLGACPPWFGSSSPSEFLCTGIPAIDLMYPIRRGQVVALAWGSEPLRRKWGITALLSHSRRGRPTVLVGRAGPEQSRALTLLRAGGAKTTVYASPASGPLQLWTARAAMLQAHTAAEAGQDVLLVWDTPECSRQISKVTEFSGHFPNGGSVTTIALVNPDGDQGDWCDLNLIADADGLNLEKLGLPPTNSVMRRRFKTLLTALLVARSVRDSAEVQMADASTQRSLVLGRAVQSALQLDNIMPVPFGDQVLALQAVQLGLPSAVGAALTGRLHRDHPQLFEALNESGPRNDLMRQLWSVAALHSAP